MKIVTNAAALHSQKLSRWRRRFVITCVLVGLIAAIAIPSSQGAVSSIPGAIAFQSDREINTEIWVMDVDGSKQKRLTLSPFGSASPAWSPDGRRLAFQRPVSGEAASIFVLSRAAATPTRLVAGLYPSWAPDGKSLAFTRVSAKGSGIFQVSLFGRKTRRLTAPAFSVLDLFPSWSPTGEALVFVRMQKRSDELSGRTEFCGKLLTMGVGKRTRFLTKICADEGDDNIGPNWSPDGKQIAYVSNRFGSDDIWVMNADGSGRRRLTRSAATESSPAWSRDGRSIAFSSDRSGDFDLYVMNSDGTGIRRLTNSPSVDVNPSWQPAAESP